MGKVHSLSLSNPTWLDPVKGAVTRLMNTEDLAAALEASEQDAPTKKKTRTTAMV